MSAPVLHVLIASNQALTAEWTNNPYVGIHNAFITVVNATTNVMSNIYLSEEEALLESYTIQSLTNGVLYYVSYTQIQGTPDTPGILSNTLSAKPCTVPLAPALISVVYVNGASATATVTLPTNTSGAAYENITFVLLNETTGAISQQIFTSLVSTSTTFVLTGLTSSVTYIISCQLVNDAGYSSLSNSVEFVNSFGVPVAPVLNNVYSGYDEAVQFLFTPTQQSVPPLLSRATFEYQLVTAGNSWSLLGVYNLGSWTSGQISVLSSSLPAPTLLTNGANYNFRCFVSTESENSPPSNVLTGVPALASSFSTPSLVVNHDGTTKIATGLQSGWLMGGALITGTFPASTVTSQFSYLVGAIPGTSATQNMITNAASGSAVLPVVGLTLGSTCSVSMLLQTVIPPANQPYWLNAPTNYIIQYTPTLTKTATVTTLPGPVTNITYISGITGVGVGAIQFFWDQPANTGYELISNYTLNLYVGYPSGQAYLQTITTAGPVENYTFTSLPTSNAYWVTICANNSVGAGSFVSFPQSLEGIYITQPTVETPIVAPSQLNTTTVNIAYAIPAAAPTGQIYNSFDLYSIAPNGVQTYITSQSYATGTLSYSYLYTISSVPAFYTFGVILNATITSVTPNYPASSLMGLGSVQSSGAPIIGVPTFSTNSVTGNGIVTVSINKNGSDIITNGGMLFVLPSNEGANPVNILNGAQIIEINNATQPYTLVYQLLYSITTAPGYLISMSNSSGSSYVDGNLQ
jgi:hypothetical protein